jgi:hypothetical protein
MGLLIFWWDNREVEGLEFSTTVSFTMHLHQTMPYDVLLNDTIGLDVIMRLFV